MIKNGAANMRMLGFEWEVLSTGSMPGCYVDEMIAENIPVYHLPFSRNPFFFLKFFQILRRERFDVLHIHCERASFWYALMGRISGVPKIVRSYHSVFRFTGFLRMRRSAQRWFARRMLGVVNHAIGPSVQRCEWETFRNPADVILNWVDETLFTEIDPDERARARRSLAISEKSFTVTSVGACLDIKNHEDILRALQLSRLTERDSCYIHVGTGPLLSREQELAKSMGLDGCVRFAGQCPSDKVREIYAASDVVVMPSDYEGLGIVVLEAIKCGRPVIAYDVPGLRDYNCNQKGGMWIPPSAEALAEALQAFAESPDLLRRKSAEAADIANRLFSKGASLRALARLYLAET